MSKELVIKAKNGNIQALNKLINNHKELAFSIALKHLKNKEDAEDIVQNSFIIVLESLKNFRNEAKFSTWLYKIIYHECLKELKRKNITVEYLPQFVEVENNEVNFENILNLKNIFKALKPNEYTVIVLFYLEEKSINEIALITSLSKANVKVLLHRTRLKMQQAINKKNIQNER
ncbi:MAG TPA: sigma-70 family RNA polymerase sigma factor [Flavobacteriia bacterium]|jgi:RNA polymerase sigma-70 factor (ECF subfamily)|nr:sigma-70 family RNA polymerase sigma factor [Flavobacteriia bacterium]